MEYQVIEIALGSGYLVYIEVHESEFNRIIEQLQSCLPEPVTFAIGTVVAASERDAMLLVQQGKWQYTQSR
jgi:hypothetical protein